MKRIVKFFAVFTLLLSISLPVSADSDNTDKGIDEKNGPEIIVYGGNLTAEQKKETAKLLNVDEEADHIEITVTGEDIKKYIDGDPNSRMFSSAKIKRLDKGKGIEVVQITPENITEVTDEMYANALITAGVEDARIEVASPVKVTGHSALTGIFKAYEVSGEDLDTARLEVASEELDVATSLAEDAGIAKEKVSQLLSEIKQAIGEQKPVTREEVEQIVEEQLNKLKIELSEEHKQMLIDLFEKIRNLDIDFGKVRNQLEKLAGDIKEKLKDAGVDEGFFQSIWTFMKNLFSQIAEFFRGLFS